MTYRFASRTYGTGISLIRRMNQLAREGTVNLGLGQLDDCLPSAMREAGKKLLDSGKVKYTPNAGLSELREAIANHHSQKTAVQTTKDEVIVCAGVQQALYLSCAAFLNEGDEVLVPELCFSPYRTLPKKFGAKAIDFKLDENFRIDFRDLESKVNKRTKFVMVNSPSNPTGAVLEKSEHFKLAEFLRKYNNLLLLSDEIYSDISSDVISPYRFSQNVMVADGISKRDGCGTGLRLGYLIAPGEVIDRMIPQLQDNITCAPMLSQIMAIPAYRGECKKEESAIKERLNRNRNLMVNGLREIPGLKVVEPAGSFYCFPDISAYLSKDIPNSETLALKILDEHNVLTIPGLAFGERGKNHLRISYAGLEEDVSKGLSKLKVAFQKWNQKI